MMKSRMAQNKRIILLVFLFVCFGCSNYRNHAEQPKFQNDQDNSVICYSDYENTFTLFYCDSTETKSISGRTIFLEKENLLVIQDTLKKDVPIFNFNKLPGEEYYIDFSVENFDKVEKKQIKIEVLDKIQTSKDIYYIFKLYYTFCDRNVILDQVIFISWAQKCIIGFYSLANDNGIQKIVNPRGNILKDVIEYDEIYKY